MLQRLLQSWLHVAELQSSSSFFVNRNKEVVDRSTLHINTAPIMRRGYLAHGSGKMFLQKSKFPKFRICFFFAVFPADLACNFELSK